MFLIVESIFLVNVRKGFILFPMYKENLYYLNNGRESLMHEKNTFVIKP